VIKTAQFPVPNKTTEANLKAKKEASNPAGTGGSSSKDSQPVATVIITAPLSPRGGSHDSEINGTFLMFYQAEELVLIGSLIT
jgi:hypothetical protein